VESHVANCVACRGQVRELEELRAIVRKAPMPDLTPVSRSIPDVEPASIRSAADSKPSSAPLRWLLIGQLAALLLVATLLVLRDTGRAPGPAEAAPAFRTLATAPQVAPEGSVRIRVLFDEDLEERRLRQLLYEIGGRIVDGPSASGLYSVELDVGLEDAPSVERRLEALRADERVRFAEVSGARP
jgi:hypothetical protein